jgi:hypothetical protein
LSYFLCPIVLLPLSSCPSLNFLVLFFFCPPAFFLCPSSFFLQNSGFLQGLLQDSYKIPRDFFVQKIGFLQASYAFL